MTRLLRDGPAPGGASLPMYDLPELRAATDAWWSGLARAFAAHGVEGVPPALARGPSAGELWRSPELLFSQTCGYPYSTGYRAFLQLVMTPCYRAPGCHGPTYVSLILVREGDPASTLADLDGARFAANGFDSWSGWQALGRELRIRGLRSGRFLRDARISGSHRRSIAAVGRGECRACAVDAVTHELLRRHAPAELQGLRVLDATAPAPALPYVTRADAPPDRVRRLRAGIRQALADRSLAAARDALAIDGARVLEDADYRFMAGPARGDTATQ